MELGEIISNSIRYPSTNWTKMLILGILLIIPIVNFIGWGYVLRIVKSTLAGYDELPEFDNLADLFIDGLKVLVVSIVYFIIPFIIIVAGVIGSLASISAAGMVTNPAAFTGVGVASIIGIILYILFELFWIIAVANMALYDELGAAFKFSEILERISNIGWGSYIVWYIVMIVIGIIFGIMGSIISIIPYIGYIIAVVLVYSYFAMFAGRSVALMFSSSESAQPTITKSEPIEKESESTESDEKPG